MRWSGVAVSSVLFVAMAAQAAHKIPDSAWQTGTLRSVTSDRTSRVVGTFNNGSGVVGEQVRIITHFTIESELYIYQADRTTNRHDKPLDITINAPVKFAIDGTDMYLCDDAGKPHELTIATKALKSLPTPPTK
jgi:hypothetical protein